MAQDLLLRPTDRCATEREIYVSEGNAKPRVLLVDDEEVIHQSVGGFLVESGYTVLHASSGEEALELFDAEGAEIAICDVRMPGMDGMEVMRRLKERAAEIDVIAITAYADMDIAVDVLRAGAFDFFRKPVDMQELTACLHRIRHYGEILRRMDGERLRVEEERDRFFALSLDLLCIAGFDGYFKRLNPAWERTLGFAREELLAQPFVAFLHPDDREATLEEAHQIAGGKETLTFENRYRCKDGSYRWLSWSATAVAGQQLIYAVARDITEGKRAEKELLRARDRAQAANLAKSGFLASMGHELRTPLNAIIGFSELLQNARCGELKGKQTLYVANINKSGQQLLELVNDILDLSKVKAGRLALAVETFAVDAALQEVCNVLKGLAAKKEIHLERKIDPDLDLLEADREQFEQIMLNLLGNAIKFTADGGHVEVSAANDPDGIRISVIDDGIGLRPEDQERIFGVFEQVDSSYDREQKGTGLGLALTSRLVGLHNGRIWVESKGLGKGCRFTVVLPSRTDPDQAEPALLSTAKATRGHGEPAGPSDPVEKTQPIDTPPLPHLADDRCAPANSTEEKI